MQINSNIVVYFLGEKETGQIETKIDIDNNKADFSGKRIYLPGEIICRGTNCGDRRFSFQLKP